MILGFLGFRVFSGLGFLSLRDLFGRVQLPAAAQVWV